MQAEMIGKTQNEMIHIVYAGVLFCMYIQGIQSYRTVCPASDGRQMPGDGGDAGICTLGPLAG
jgi:hypothetical protein